MNWKKFFLNLAGAAVAGASTVFVAGATSGALNGKAIAVAACAPIIANLAALFQQPPHQDGQ